MMKFSPRTALCHVLFHWQGQMLANWPPAKSRNPFCPHRDLDYELAGSPVRASAFLCCCCGTLTTVATMNPIQTPDAPAGTQRGCQTGIAGADYPFLL